MNIIEKPEGLADVVRLAKEAGMVPDAREVWWQVCTHDLERFATLVRADLMKQVMDTCEAEYEMYDKMVEEDDAGHEEATAIIHLMRKLEKLK
jgi:hypothetical protein